jgi:hypothetical protein
VLDAVYKKIFIEGGLPIMAKGHVFFGSPIELTVVTIPNSQTLLELHCAAIVDPFRC